MKFFLSTKAIFWLNLHCTCSQLLFEVHYTSKTQNLEIFNFFNILSIEICLPLGAKFLWSKHIILAVHYVKTIQSLMVVKAFRKKIQAFIWNHFDLDGKKVI